MISTTTIPAELLRLGRLGAFPPASLVIEIEPKGEAPRGYALTGLFLNDDSTAIDRPGLVCLTPWSSLGALSGDVLLDDTLPMVGLFAEDIELTTEVDATNLVITETLNTDARPAVLVKGEVIVGMRKRGQPTQRISMGLHITGNAVSIPPDALHLSAWTLCVNFDGYSAEQQLKIPVA